MSTGEHSNYKFDHTLAAKNQINQIATTATQSGKLSEFIAILESAVHRMQSDPHSFGDPEYHLKFVEGIVFHATLRPIAFRYVVHEQVRAVVLLDIRLYADFD